MDLGVGDSARDLTFVARGLDGRPVTELRGAVTVGDASVVAVDGTRIRAKQSGASAVIVDVGDARASMLAVVYAPVTSFVGNARKPQFMAMRVSLARGDTIVTPVPKSAFW